jgi:hypothetical protein
MTALAETSLSANERALIERFVEELRMRLAGRDKVILEGPA